MHASKFITAAFLLPAAMSTACLSPTPRSIIKTGLDIAQIACVIVHDNVDDTHVLAKMCDISEDYLDVIRDLVLGRNQAKAMKAAAAASASASASGSGSVKAPPSAPPSATPSAPPAASASAKK